jgi:hypothetical protein
MAIISQGMSHVKLASVSSSYEELPCWSHRLDHRYLSSVERIPVDSRWKDILIKEYTRKAISAYVYNIWDVYLVLFRIGSQQVRSVYITSSGHLLEYEESIPHLRRLGIFSYIASQSFNEERFEQNDRYTYKYLKLEHPVFWSGFQTNYTHFLLDEYSHLLLLGKSAMAKTSNATLLALADYRPAWCNEWINNLDLNEFTLTSNASVTTVKIKQLLMPIVPTLSQKVDLLKTCLAGFGGRRNRTENCQGVRTILFVESFSWGVPRISNFAEILSTVSSHFPIMNWKPEDMSTNAKITFLASFATKPIIVCMGSCIMNCVLFSEFFHRIIILVDPSSVCNSDYLHGGWAYYQSVYHLCEYVVGNKSNTTSSDYISSCYYNAEEIVTKLCAMKFDEASDNVAK